MDKDYEHYKAMILKKAKSWQITIDIPDFEECLSVANLGYAQALRYHEPEKGSFSNYLWRGIDIQFMIYYHNHLKRWERISVTKDGVLEVALPKYKGVFSFHHKLIDLSKDARRVVDYIFEYPEEFCWKGFQIRRSNGSLKKKIASLGYSWRKATKIIAEIKDMLREGEEVQVI